MKAALKFIVVLVVIASCKKEEPFEYPEDPGKNKAELITYSVRNIKSDENWQMDKKVDECDVTVPVGNIAVHELNYSSGLAFMQAVPTSNTCRIDMSLSSSISQLERSNFPWDSLAYEFTWSEYKASDGSRVLLSLYYKNLEFTLNIAPYIEQLEEDKRGNGLFKLEVNQGKPVCTLSGMRIYPDFTSGSGNTFILSGSGDENFYSIQLLSEGTTSQSYIAFNYMRITRFGLPEAK